MKHLPSTIVLLCAPVCLLMAGANPANALNWLVGLIASLNLGMVIRICRH